MKRTLAGLGTLAALVCMVGPVLAAEPRCNVMQFFDAQGALVPTAAPVVGMMVGERPVYDPSVTGAASIRPGAEVSCPPSLVDGIRSTFEKTCTSDQRRRQAASEHKVDTKAIDKGCADMRQALGTALTAPK